MEGLCSIWACLSFQMVHPLGFLTKGLGESLVLDKKSVNLFQ